MTKRTKLWRKESHPHYLKHKEKAKELILKKVAHHNSFYNFPVNNISVRNSRRLWGSCSRKNNLSFNFRLLLVPEPLLDYVVVHELCHLGQFDHSKDFWQLVARTIPDHNERRRQLKSIRFADLETQNTV